MGGACLFVAGEVDNLADYRPTGINFNNRISSLKPEYRPRTKMTIAAFYDAPDSQKSEQEQSQELRDNAINALNETLRINRIFRDSGLNIHVYIDFHQVNNVEARMINQSLDAIGTFEALFRDTKKDDAYALYFPSKVPVDARNELNHTGDQPASNWDGIAFLNPSSNQREHWEFLERSGFGIVVPEPRTFVGAHEWGHIAGLSHVAGEGNGIKPYGVGRYTELFGGLTSFSTVMNAANQLADKTHLLFSSPKIKCDLPKFWGFWRDIDYLVEPEKSIYQKSVKVKSKQ